MDLNSTLAETYRKYWPNLQNVLSETTVIENNLSYPLLIHIFPEYETALIKLFVVGQQTNGWQKKCDSDPIPLLMERSTKFHLGDGPKARKSPFWQACHKLNLTLNPSGSKYGFVWSNLVRIEQDRRRPLSEWEEVVSSAFPVLPLEIEITHPDVVVFFTGPGYDSRLKKTFNGLTFEAVGNYPCKVLARVIHNNLPYNSFRTYHPIYIRRANKRLKLENIINEIKSSLRGV